MANDDTLPPNIVIVLKADYDQNKPNFERIEAMFYNCIFDKYGIVKTRSIIFYKGSIGINSAGTGTAAQASALSADILNGNVNINGFEIQSATVLDQVVKAADSTNTGSTGGGSSTESDSAKQNAVI